MRVRSGVSAAVTFTALVLAVTPRIRLFQPFPFAVVGVPGIIEGHLQKEVYKSQGAGGCCLNLDLAFVRVANTRLKAAGFSEVRSYWSDGREALF